MFDQTIWKRTYGIKDIQITAEVIESRQLDSGALEVTVRTGCPDQDNDNHYQTNTTTLTDVSGGAQLEDFMRSCAAWLRRLLWEKPQVRIYVAELLKTTGDIISLPCTIDVSQPNTFIHPMFVEASAAPLVGVFRPPEDPQIALPMHLIRLRFGKRVIEVSAISAAKGWHSILGGALVQQAAEGDLSVLYEVFLTDLMRALGTAARAKRKTVLILGSYSKEGRERMNRTREALETKGFVGVQLDDFADIHQQSLFEKMLMFGSLSRFLICDDSISSGHLMELKAAADIGFVTIILRPEGRSATWMNAEIAKGRDYMRVFPYKKTEEFLEIMNIATEWAEQKVAERVEYHNREYPWRKPHVQLG
jgi:hypothetical protein